MKNIARTAKGSDISGEESGDELGGLSDSDLDDIFNDLDKKVKIETTAKTKTVIPKELEGLGLESLLDELDAALNCKAPVFKPVIVANKSWWVPENYGQLLAVQIDQAEQYQQAIVDKMAKLAEEWGGWRGRWHQRTITYDRRGQRTFQNQRTWNSWWSS